MKNKVVLLLRLVSALILLQTLFFKFSAAPESIYIFTKLGVEPYGRLFAGVSELAASILLLVPATYILGALATVTIMAGAILSHIFVLGIVVQDDGGLLFILANIVLIASVAILWIQKDELLSLIDKILKTNLKKTRN